MQESSKRITFTVGPNHLECFCGGQCPGNSIHCKAQIYDPNNTPEGKRIAAFSLLLTQFSAAMLEKFKLNEIKRAEQGLSSDWESSNWQSNLINQLYEHVDKGDARDTGILSAMAWYHGWHTGKVEPYVIGADGRRVLAPKVEDFDAQLDLFVEPVKPEPVAEPRQCCGQEQMKMENGRQVVGVCDDCPYKLSVKIRAKS